MLCSFFPFFFLERILRCVWIGEQVWFLFKAVIQLVSYFILILVDMCWLGYEHGRRTTLPLGSPPPTVPWRGPAHASSVWK